MLTRDEDLIHCAGSISQQADDIAWNKDMAEMLNGMAKQLHIDADKETNNGFSMRLELLRLEAWRLAQDYSREGLRLSLTASVESGE